MTVHLYVITYQLGFKPNDELTKVPYALSDYYLIVIEMIKPVYLRDKDIQSDKKNIVRDFEISIAVSKCNDDLKCVQKDRYLWRLNVGWSIDSRYKLLCEGFELRSLSVKAFDINQFSAGKHHPNERVLRVTVKGAPLSVDDVLSLYQSECRKLLRSVSSRIGFSLDTGIEETACNSSC